MDAFRPDEMARLVRDDGLVKARESTSSTLALGVLAGAFVALGAAFATATLTGSTHGYGTTRLLAGVAFATGFVLALVGGGQLVTSNSLLVMAWASRTVGLKALARNWGLVGIGNVIGAVCTAGLLYASGQTLLEGATVGATALAIAELKLSRSFEQAVVAGLIGNGLVCLAVWLSYSAHSTTDRIVAVVLPITAMVALNVDHVVGNLYYLAMGFLAQHQEPVRAVFHVADTPVPTVDPGPIAQNLGAVTLGNVLGGGVLVAAFYWFIYLRSSGSPTTPSPD